MRNALWAALLLGIVAVAAAADKPAPAIINGQDAQRGRYRYIVSLRPTDDETFHFCGGTLIHPRVVLTAAHAYIGGYETDQASQFEKISVQKTEVNPNFVTGNSKTQKLSMTLLSNQECKNRMGSKHNFATNTMVCAARVFSDIGMLFNWIDAQVFEWTGERLTPWSPPPPPFKPVTGTVLANNVGTGFDGKPVTYTGAKGAPLDIISSVPAKGMGWYLNGILTDGTTPGSQALGYVAWSYGATLAAQAGPNGRLAVTLNNKRIHPGHPPNLGQLVTIKYPKDSCRRGWCADRLVEITVRPFIKVAITQPWIPGANWGAWGSFAPYLQVYRYMVSLRSTTDPKWHFCGGTLIHPQVVLTAAHCVRDTTTGVNEPDSSFRPLVRIGGYTRTKDTPSQYQQFRVQATVVHPNFATGYTSPITYLRQMMLSLAECQAQKGSGKGPGTIKTSFDFDTNSMICAERPGTGNLVGCKGDSGGPLLVLGADPSKDYQVGIVSWSSSNCNAARPINVYTDVGVEFNWIADQVFKWTGDRLRPWTPTPPPFKPVTGTVLADNVGTGFDGKPVTYTGAKGDPLDIISSVPAQGMGWYLNGILTDGSVPGSQALRYIAWSYGATLAAQASPNGRLTVTLNKKVVKPGQPPNLGQLVTIKYPRDKCGQGWCAARLLEITVRPFITVTITQPWIPGANWGSWGAFAPYLDVPACAIDSPARAGRCPQPAQVAGVKMRAALCASLLLGMLAAAAAADKPTPAIINGKDAPRGRFRYMAQLRNADKPTRPHCDGALIHPRVILTAGHCVRDTGTGADFPPEYLGLWCTLAATCA
ncbi:trypsin-like serine protease [Chlorella sorokiniana]|uniref:Trypsin-like serine protease n=1 Tax=Chlorella sorokiniana TaxID=3076 RepID=A0A2P6U5G7_CHLSO|nr:trypsin-like serine protease [Chlorella sorokiniana]|eukprot:PRW61561.1 trypsin-like serine protease [Chlorella sorokiniana]